MDEKLHEQITFHLTGSRGDTTLKPMTAAYRPAIFARYADLTSLRYDFPLVLNNEGATERAVLSLSRLIDEVVGQLAGDPDRDRIARHAYQIERELRSALAAGGTFDFATLWNEAVAKLGADDDNLVSSAKLLWTKFFAAGQIADVDAKLPHRMIRHLWQAVEKEKARRFRDRAERLLYKLHNILEAEAQGSTPGRTPERLRAGFGTSFAGTFDFNMLSRVIGESKPPTRLSDSRRERITRVINILERQQFYRLGNGQEPYSFEFDNCAKAIRAFQDRQNDATELLKALAVGDLESKGEYRDSVHNAIFDGFGAEGPDFRQLSQLPSYLITVNTTELSAEEVSGIIEIMSTGLPMKVSVQADDILESSRLFPGQMGLGSIPRRLVQAAIGLTNAFVLQATASALYGSRDALIRGFKFEGPALFSIFSGANPFTTTIKPYLVAAAAAESRAFPSFMYDPAAGSDWSTRFTITDNPNADTDWPSHSLEYEDESLQWHSERIAFTFAEFLAMDERYHKHFALVPPNECSDAMITIPEALATNADAIPSEVPSLSFVDEDFHLHRGVVDMRAMREVRRCLNMWRSQQELGGINNSYVGRLLASGYAPATDAPPAGFADGPEIAALTEASIEEPEPIPAKIDSDEPYIETPRCTTCNECTQVNNKMFAYNADKQAYIADAGAGTFRELVEAAESCQVGIIHPGKPRNTKEPGLEDLIKRAAEFN